MGAQSKRTHAGLHPRPPSAYVADVINEVDEDVEAEVSMLMLPTPVLGTLISGVENNN